MTFADLAVGDDVFLDANGLVYHFAPHPILGPASTQLVQQIEQGVLAGFTSTHILTEMAHRLMVFEASALPGWTLTGAKRRLQRQPAIIQTLTLFERAVDTVLKSPIRILTIDPPLVLAAA